MASCRASLLIGLLLIFSVPPALAESADVARIDRQATSLSDRVMSPYCPAVTLSACTSPNAKSLRKNIRGWLEDGMEVKEIESKLIADFGPGVLGTPTKSGFGLVGWTMPFVVFILGGFAIYRVVKKSQTKQAPAQASGAEGTESGAEGDIRARLEQEIKDRMLGQ